MKEKKARNNEIRMWRKQGYTYSFIGELFGISKQCAHQIDHKKPKKKLGFWGRLKRWLIR